MRLYLGTNSGHDSSVAVVNAQGQLLFAAEEGKLIGEKYISRFPTEGLRQVAAQFPDADWVWSEGWKPFKRLTHKGLLRAATFGWQESWYIKHGLQKEASKYLETKRAIGIHQKSFGRVQHVGHHLAHAWSLVPSGLPNCSLVLVSDASSEHECISTFYFDGSHFRAIESSQFPNSVGRIYHQAAYHLGFGGRTGPGKLMALAAQGNPTYFDHTKKMANVVNGRLLVDFSEFPAWKHQEAWLTCASMHNTGFGAQIKNLRGSLASGADLAASVQATFLELTWSLIEQSLVQCERLFGVRVKAVGLSGGCALNCSANGQINLRLEAKGYPPLVLSPWPDDSGTAIGAATYGYFQNRTPDDASMPIASPLIGPYASRHECDLSAVDMIAAVQCIASGGLVALVADRLEFGPRALGARCILGDPRRPESASRINELKKRPSFMPVAPAVLATHCSALFKGSASHFMAATVAATELAMSSIPGCLHVDGSARVQLVDDQGPPQLLRVLRCFHQLTGVPALLLTSLNESNEAVPVDLDSALHVSRKLGLDGALCEDGWFAWAVK